MILPPVELVQLRGIHHRPERESQPARPVERIDRPANHRRIRGAHRSTGGTREKTGDPGLLLPGREPGPVAPIERHPAPPFLRGPGWNFFGVYENWDVNKVEPLLNINVSEIVWVKTLGTPLPKPWYLRELWGILIVGFYFTVVPVAFAKTIGKKLFMELGAIRFGIVANLGLIMLAVPLKMLARWLFNLKYVVYLPEILTNI